MSRPFALLLLVAPLLLACPDPSGAPADAGGPDAARGDSGTSDAGRADAGLPASDGGSEATTELARLDALVAALKSAGSTSEREALVETFFDAVAWGEQGFPIRASGRFAVALYDPRGGSFSVAGDFNAWSASSDPLLQPVAGFPFFHRTVEAADPTSRSLYKFVRNGAEWFADPKARRHGYDAFGEYSLLSSGPGSSHLERWHAFGDPAGVLAPRDLTVYVPAPIHTSDAPLPVLYLQDGQMLFDPASAHGGWKVQQAADEGIAQGQLQPFLIVGIDNTGARMSEYTHVADDPFGTGDVGGEAGRYAALVAEHIRPFIEARYSASALAGDRAVAGSSLGGLVSFEILRRYPDVFGHAAALSATFGWGSIARQNPTQMQRFVESPPDGARLYLDSGGNAGSGCVDSDGDGVHNDSETPDNYCETLDMRATLQQLGWSEGVDLHYAWAPDAQHNEAAWAARLPGLLRNWFPRRE